MADDAFADSCPFFEIRRRRGPVCLDYIEIFDGNAKAVENPAAGVDQIPQINIGKGEVVGSRIVRIGVKIAEDVRNVDQDIASVGAAGVMRP